MQLILINYWAFFVGAAALYAAFYLGPLWGTLRALRPHDLDDLEMSLQRDLSEVKTSQSPNPEDVQVESFDGSVSAEANGGAKRWATERLSRLDGLRSQYRGIVQEAVDQIRAQYPEGAYQRFEIERLPSVAAFSERLGSARTMAGLFVLLGLLFTMVRLNGVVGGIAAAAGTASMNPAEFLTRMGELMDNIGGAFDSSIWGLGLLVCALAVVGASDWVAQRRVQKLEVFVVQKVVPTLADLKDRLMPNLTLADLLSETGGHLQNLSGTVAGLTGELDVSLSNLGDRIGRMMDDFRSFQDQYEKLDNLLVHMQKASKGLERTAGALEGAALRANDPLTTFNKSILHHVETVADWIEVSRDGFERLSNEMTAVREHTDRLVEGLARAAETGFGEGLAAHRASLAALDRQTGDIQRHLATVAAEFERTAAQRGSGDGASPVSP